jgi:hypothetical protein
MLHAMVGSFNGEPRRGAVCPEIETITCIQRTQEEDMVTPVLPSQFEVGKNNIVHKATKVGRACNLTITAAFIAACALVPVARSADEPDLIFHARGPAQAAGGLPRTSLCHRRRIGRLWA